MERGRVQMQHGRLELEPALRDFDRHARGLVTAAQFTQALDVSKIGCVGRRRQRVAGRRHGR